MQKLAFVMLGALFLSACKEEIYTVDEFMKNDELRKTFLAKCNNGELHNQELNCQNSRKADQNKVMLNSITDHKL